jgi:hypothetical protein
VHEESTGKETAVWSMTTVVDEDALAEEYDAIVDALTHPAQAVRAGTSVPSFEEYLEQHPSPPMKADIYTESTSVTGSFQIPVVSGNVSSERSSGSGRC